MVAALVTFYLSVFFFPYPLFPNHMEHTGFSVYSDREIPEDFRLILEDARRRIEAMELFRGQARPRIFICHSQRLFMFLNRWAGKRHAGQGLLISVFGNAFFSEAAIDAVARRNRGQPRHSRFEGPRLAAIAREVAQHLMTSELGFRKARRLPAWKSQGYADFSANLASVSADSDHDLRRRLDMLLDDDAWLSSAGFIDRRHIRWQLLVEYLCTVEGLSFGELMNDEISKERNRTEMMTWYSSLGPPTSDEGPHREPSGH